MIESLSGVDLRPQHHANIRLREKIVRVCLVADLWRAFWTRGMSDVEIVQIEDRQFGYDLLIGHGAVVRHVAVSVGLRRRPVQINVPRSLAIKPAGCLIHVDVDFDLAVRAYWFYGAYGEALGGSGNNGLERFLPPFRTDPHRLGVDAFTEVGGLAALCSVLLPPLS